ncbi:uncharacterized protein P884DRAFT_255423 [Thermothelomyces heterothallicus CBS 202.75]|uniref:uncharacterized protein n=1 Tax=Thermothelomyces heterothallicus CBS 202.75 TaxID=1149848 RepID=UPI003743DFF2
MRLRTGWTGFLRVNAKTAVLRLAGCLRCGCDVQAAPHQPPLLVLRRMGVGCRVWITSQRAQSRWRRGGMDWPRTDGSPSRTNSLCRLTVLGGLFVALRSMTRRRRLVRKQKDCTTASKSGLEHRAAIAPCRTKIMNLVASVH